MQFFSRIILLVFLVLILNQISFAQKGTPAGEKQLIQEELLKFEAFVVKSAAQPGSDH